MLKAEEQREHAPLKLTKYPDSQFVHVLLAEHKLQLLIETEQFEQEPSLFESPLPSVVGEI